MTNLDEAIMEEMDYATFVKIISDIPSCIFFKDTDLKYRFSSHCWAQLISDDIVGKTDLDIRKDKENAAKAMEADREIIATKKGCSYVIKSDIDGEVSYLELIKEPIINDDGAVIGIVGLINDVTENTNMKNRILGMSEMLKEKCRDQKAALERISEMNAAQKMFTASMNHELRSPLNGIIGNLQLLLEDDSLSDTQREYIDNAFAASQLMLGIVNELLDYAKLEMTGFSIKKERFELSSIIKNIDFFARVQANNKGIDFSVMKDEGMPDFFISDAKRINQIITNLVSNAIKYTEQGSIILSVAYEDGKLVIVCSDTGQGIAKESIGRLFDPYVRFNEERNAGIQGTGLGLSVVKKIIDNMDGSITVDSQVGTGSTFTVRVPVEIADGSCSRSAQADSAIVSGEKMSFEGMSALCVDDSQVNAQVMAALLNKIGMSSEVALGGAKALEMTAQKKYDVIFMDHMMPGIDGIETFKRIRESDCASRQTPIVMLTGNSGDTSEALYRETGVDGYLIKPVLKAQLEDMLAGLLSVRR